jgi:hypothetical protein
MQPDPLTIDMPPGDINNDWVAEQAAAYAVASGYSFPEQAIPHYYCAGGWNYQWGDPGSLPHVVKARVEGGKLTIRIEVNDGS